MVGNIQYRYALRFFAQPAGLIFCLLTICNSAYAQLGDTIPTFDSARIVHIKKKGEEEARKSIQQFNTTRLARKQEELLENIRKTTQKSQDFINGGIDLSASAEELSTLKKWLFIAEDGVLRNTDSVQTFRNLTTTTKLLAELYQIGLANKNELDYYSKELTLYRYKLDSLNSDSALYSISSDSVAMTVYLKKVSIATRDIGPADSVLNKTIAQVANLQVNWNLFVNDLELNMQLVDDYQTKLSSRLTHQEFNHFDAPSRSFGQILTFSKAKAKLALWFYIKNNPGKIFFLILLISAVAFFLHSLKEKLEKGDTDISDLSGYVVLRYTFLSAIVIVLSIFQFIFSEPTFAFSIILWIISALCLSFVFWKSVSRFWIQAWLIMMVIFFLACGDNLILQASRVERIGMLVFALIGIVVGLYYLWQRNRRQLHEKYLVWFLALVVVFEAGSVLANLAGRYNLSKSLFISGFSNMVFGVLFLWTIRLINEGLTIAARLYNGQERKLLYVNFDRVGGKAPGLLYVFLILGWFILIGRNFYFFRLIWFPLRHFYTAERTIGNFSFSLERIFTFFIIVSISVIISKIVSFFASDHHFTHNMVTQTKSTGVGSWLLLIRVGIISGGLLLALAASGFPMDRITIILGALGVGIGFGFQTLVNNLVSGLIIAFEKPVNVGDFVEISGQTGTMKSIGFRSSIISKSEGADVVIPNGELLNAHLVNWTHGGGRRRMEIMIGITHGSDHERIRQLLTVVLDSIDQILKYPKPEVIFNEITGIRIEVKIQFWVKDVRRAFIIRGNAISAIDLAFKNNGITIPVSLQELYLYSFNPASDPAKKS